MNFYKSIVRPLLFSVSPELAHVGALEACRLAGRLPLLPRLLKSCLQFNAAELASQVAGLVFANPLGLAAGWDKNGRGLRVLDQLGFGFVEIGSISAQPSAGNPKPRLFRLPQDRAIVVNYGLPNDGAAVVARRLTAVRPAVPLGINVVKTNFGPGAAACSREDILADYHRSVSLLQPHAGYLSLNLSCPNAEGGKDFFATQGSIADLLAVLQPLEISCPVFLKVAPDPAPQVIDRLLEEASPFDFVRGFLFNLPSGKPPTLELTTPRSKLNGMPGAVAGKPVRALLNGCITELYRRMPVGRFAIIGGGGVFSAEDAYEKICLGASLVQIYSALVYEGPGVVKRINRGLCAQLARDGFKTLSEAVGSRNKDVRGSRAK